MPRNNEPYDYAKIKTSIIESYGENMWEDLISMENRNGLVPFEFFYIKKNNINLDFIPNNKYRYIKILLNICIKYDFTVDDIISIMTKYHLSKNIYQ